MNNSPKDILMHIFVMVGLYISAGTFLSLVFGLINGYFPDPLNAYYYYDSASAIRWPLAILTVIFPLYVWGSRFLVNDIAANPWKNEMRVRKWLVYITLFIAAAIIIGDFVSLLYNFLEGELSTRFILKTIAVFAVGMAAFIYYRYDLRRGGSAFSPRMKIFVAASCVIITAIIISGFVSAGSPFRQRLVRFDEQKVMHLQTIQNQIVYFWQQKNRLPQSLDELKDSISGFTSPRDPQSGSAYSYRAIDNLSFEICADFNFSSAQNRFIRPVYPVAENDNWEHGAGDYCFRRSIDPEIYGKIQR